MLFSASSKVVFVYLSHRDLDDLHDNTDLDATALDSVVLLVLWFLVLHLLLWLLVVLLLMLWLLLARVSARAAILHLLLLARVATRHRVCSSVVRLAILRVLRLVLLDVVEVRHLRWSSAAGLQFNIDAAFVVLGIVL